MKKFILHTLSFVLVFFMLLVIAIIYNYFLVKTTPIVIPVNKHILILGDSTSEYAINDSIFKSSSNLSSSSDSYFYSYLKLKKVIKTNKVDTLMLSISPHNIFGTRWLFNDSNIYSRFRTYYPLMDYSDFIYLLNNNPSAVCKSIPIIIKRSGINTVKKILNIPFNYGGFRALDRDILTELKEKLKNGKKLPFFYMSKTFIVADNEIKYLNKIISICKKTNIKLYLANMPKRKELLESSKSGVKEFNNFYDLNYSDIEYLDFSQFKMPDNFYGDFVHLNFKGAIFFSNSLENKGWINLKAKYERTTINKNNDGYHNSKQK